MRTSYFGKTKKIETKKKKKKKIEEILLHKWW